MLKGVKRCHEMPNWSPLDLSSELALLLIESIVRVMVTVSRAVRGVPFKEFRSSVEAKPLAKKFPPSVSSEKLVPLPVNERFAAGAGKGSVQNGTGLRRISLIVRDGKLVTRT